MSAKLLYNDVKNECNANGFTLLDSYYINNNHKMNVQCLCGNTSQISFKSIKKGHKCQICANNKTFDMEYVKNYFLTYDYICTSIEYKNKDTKLNYICPKGHIGSTTFGNFKNRNARCKKCENINRNGIASKWWNPDRDKVELNKKMNILCCGLVSRCLKLSNKTKTTKTEILLGYTRKQLLEHLETDPNFDNWKNNTKNWHIDHVFPIKAFSIIGIFDPKIINALDNLRIISAKENRNKSDKYNLCNFLNYITNKEYILNE